MFPYYESITADEFEVSSSLYRPFLGRSSNLSWISTKQMGRGASAGATDPVSHRVKERGRKLLQWKGKRGMSFSFPFLRTKNIKRTVSRAWTIWVFSLELLLTQNACKFAFLPHNSSGATLHLFSFDSMLNYIPCLVFTLTAPFPLSYISERRPQNHKLPDSLLAYWDQFMTILASWWLRW